MLKNLIFLALKVVTAKPGYDAGFTMEQSMLLHKDAFDQATGKYTGVDENGNPEFDETHSAAFDTAAATYIRKVVGADPIANINVPDATNEASAVTLVNELKSKYNALLTNMRAAGTLETAS